MSLLFVCAGNTCRSPLAEAVARLIRPDLDVSSAGTRAYAGAPCPAEAVRAAAAFGVDLSRHRARPLEAGLVARAEVVAGMDADHVRAAVALGGAGKARLLAGTPILDPFGGDEGEYARRYAEIEAAVTALLAALPPPRPTPHTPPWVGKEVHPPPAASVPGDG